MPETASFPHIVGRRGSTCRGSLRPRCSPAGPHEEEANPRLSQGRRRSPATACAPRATRKSSVCRGRASREGHSRRSGSFWCLPVHSPMIWQASFLRLDLDQSRMDLQLRVVEAPDQDEDQQDVGEVHASMGEGRQHRHLHARARDACPPRGSRGSDASRLCSNPTARMRWRARSRLSSPSVRPCRTCA